LDYPFQNITVNLAPADIKKEGSGFDLPMAISILGTNETLLKKDLNDYLFLGELSLDGSLRPIKGALLPPSPHSRKASEIWCCRKTMPAKRGGVKGISVYGMKTLPQVLIRCT
jgi:magnesium chelatase family protein